MIADGLSYVTAAYVVALGGLGVLALVLIVRARAWAKRAAELEPRR